MNLPQPVQSLLELEARNSNRTVEQQLIHVLTNRYKALRGICECGFFIYNISDAQECAHCHKKCCSNCSVPRANETVICRKCAPELGIDLDNAVSFRVVEPGKL